MRRRRLVRSLALALPVVSASGLAACDTNDGRDMKEPDPYQAYVLENSTPSTTSTTTTIAPPPTAPAPSTTVAAIVDALDTVDGSIAVSGPETAAPATGDSAAASVSDPGSDSTPATTPSSSVAPPPPSSAISPSSSATATAGTAAGSVDPSLPVDTFAESIGLADLRAAGVDFTGPWPSGGEIALEYTCNGDGEVPLLTWTAPPEGTVEMAVVVVDETAENFAHWIVIALPPDAGSLGGLDPVVIGTEATNSGGQIGWAPPCPDDPGVHTYRSTLYALDEAVGLPAESDPGELIQAIEASAIGAASFAGTYQVV